jgi:hypothetical protein
VRAWNDRGSGDESSEQRGEKHAVIEANGRSVTRLSVRIRREHTRGGDTAGRAERECEKLISRRKG